METETVRKVPITIREYTLEEKCMRHAAALSELAECVMKEKEAKVKTMKARYELSLVEDDIRTTRQDLMSA